MCESVTTTTTLHHTIRISFSFFRWSFYSDMNAWKNSNSCSVTDMAFLHKNKSLWSRSTVVHLSPGTKHQYGRKKSEREATDGATKEEKQAAHSGTLHVWYRNIQRKLGKKFVFPTGDSALILRESQVHYVKHPTVQPCSVTKCLIWPPTLQPSSECWNS